MTDEIKSPYIPGEDEPKFDYNAMRDETSVEAIKAIWKVLGEHPEKLVSKTVPTEEEVKQFNDNANFIEERIVEILIQNKVPMKDLPWLSEQMIGALVFVFGILANRKKNMEREFLSRSIGARNPGVGNFDYEFSKVDDVLKALVDIREKNGDKGADY
jgi:hypothetical protein